MSGALFKNNTSANGVADVSSYVGHMPSGQGIHMETMPTVLMGVHIHHSKRNGVT